jgi:cytochrome c-type biogenesis protein CcmE
LGAISDSSTYADFDEAFANPGKTYHVVGQLNKDKETTYNPELNADLFIFYLIDNKGVEKEVKLLKSKPQDFERSEQIVIIGKAVNNAFVANDILLKCPSKYEDGAPEHSQQKSEY